MKIQLKRSNVLQGNGAKEPSAGQMEYGELAVNYNEADPAIFIKDSNNTIIRIAGADNIADDGTTNVPSGTTPPTSPAPEAGNLWFNSEEGRLYIYYVDADSSQWVDASPDSWDATIVPDPNDPADQPGTIDSRYVSKISTSSQDMVGDLTLGGTNITFDASEGSAVFIKDTLVGAPSANIFTQKNGAAGQVFYNYDIAQQGDSETPASSTAFMGQVWAADGTKTEPFKVSYDGSAVFVNEVRVGDNITYGEPHNAVRMSTFNDVTGTVEIHNQNDTSDANAKSFLVGYGVGTNAPVTRLSNDGSAGFSGAVQVLRSGITGPSDTTTQLTNIELRGSGNATNTTAVDLRLSRWSGVDGNARTKLGFYLRNTDELPDAYAEVFTLESSGNVKVSASVVGNSWDSAGGTGTGYFLGSTGNVRARRASSESDDATLFAGYKGTGTPVFEVTAGGDVTMKSQNGGPLAGFRNYLINGDFTVWQRGDQNRGAGTYYAADRWRWSTGGSVIVSRNAHRGFRYNQTAFFGNVGVNFGQRIEGVNALSNYEGQEVTFSFYYRVDSQADTTPQNTPAVKINILNDYGIAYPDGPTPTSSEYIYQGPLVILDNDGEWHRYTQTITVPETLSKTLGLQGTDYTNFGVNIINQSDNGVGVYVLDFRGFQIEAGAVATPFEYRPPAAELELCRRYCYRFEYGARDTQYIFQRQSNTDQYFSQMVTLPTPMRVWPTTSGVNMGSWRIIAGAGYDIAFNGLQNDVRGVPFTNVAHFSLKFQRNDTGGSWDTTWIRSNYNGYDANPPILPPYIIFDAEF